MRKIAIVFGRHFESDYETAFIAQSITDWTEVEDDMYNALVAWCRNHYSYEGSYHVIEQITSRTNPMGLNYILAEASKELEKLRRAEAERVAKAAEAKAKREAREQERKRKQLEKLKRELGET